MDVKIELTLDRETKNMVRYVEAARPHKLFSGMIYISKEALGGTDFPRERLTVAPKVKLAVVRA